MTGTMRFFVRMPTSSTVITSRGLVIARMRLPLSSRLSGMRRWRMMKSRGSRPMALACGAVWARSTTPMRIWPATAVTMSCSVTRPSLTSTSPRRPPSLRWRLRAPSSCACVTRPLATRSAPSLRRPAERCLRPLTRLSTLAPSSSGEKGLVTNSEAPSRCALSKVAKSPFELSTTTGTPRSWASVLTMRRSSNPSKVVRSRSRMMAAGGRSRSTLSVPGSPRLIATAYEPAKWRASWSRRSVSSSMIARAFLAALGTVTSRKIARLV